jgi:exonuclease
VEEQKIKTLFYDLEVSRAIAEGYGNKWEFKLVKLIRPQELMCISYKWLGDKKVTWKSRHDFASMREFIEFIRDLFDEADILVAHNARKFDNRMANRYFIKFDVDPPSPSYTVDTLQVARSNFKFESNSLNDLCEFLDLGQKEHITYADLEHDFMSGNPKRKTLSLMKKYNNMDVELLEKLYFKFLPYINNHPNVARIGNRPDACPKCGGHRLIRKGTRTTSVSRYFRWKCKDCKGWCRDRTAFGKDEDIKPRYVNAV